MPVRPLPRDLAALAAGGKAALARALSALETAPADEGLVALLDAAAAAPRGLVLGLTGPPGVGKSTLTSSLVATLRGRGETVAVIAVDPSSRRTGGALLGDRTRIATDPDDAGAFVRSMAARRRLGGIADITFPAAVLLRAIFDWVIVETVGVGQSETEIADCADLVVFCIQPGSGDALQFMKAGVMEVPDVVLVTKGDLGRPAQRAAAEARGALSLAAGAAPAVAVVSAQTGDGVAQALDAITGLAALRLSGEGLARRRREQTRAWAESRLVESIGRTGFDLLAPSLVLAEAPFAGVASAAERIRGLLHEVVKDA
jgi:LAO/AO transport system kinase